MDDINTMHRYRDSIVYENKDSKFLFEKTMFGAYILFPYDDEKKYSEFESIENNIKVRGHKFYRSIKSVNIGALPFLPGSTFLVQNLLSDLINDSKETAFERTSVPVGMDDKLEVVDWQKKDVHIVTLASDDEFVSSFNSRCCYAQKNQIDEYLPIHYVALYHQKLKEIRYYGEIIEISKSTEGNAYCILVKNWIEIFPKPIIQNDFEKVAICTNIFLLKNSEYISELQFNREEELRFYTELKRMVGRVEISARKKCISFRYLDNKFVFEKDEIHVFQSGVLIQSILIKDFCLKPAEKFRLIKSMIENSQGFTGSNRF